MQAVTAAWVPQGRGMGLGATREGREFDCVLLPYRACGAQVSVRVVRRADNPLSLIHISERGQPLVGVCWWCWWCVGLVADVVADDWWQDEGCFAEECA